MDKPAVIKPALRKKFQRALDRGQAAFFSAPCGFGKTTTAEELLKDFPVLRLDPMGRNWPETLPAGAAVLIDGALHLRENAQQQMLVDALENGDIHLVLLSRGAPPGWLSALQYEGLLKIFTAEDMFFDRAETERLLRLHGCRLSEQETDEVQELTQGYPLALSILCRRMKEGRTCRQDADGSIRRELFAYFQEAVYQRLDMPTRRLLLDLAPFEPFDLTFAQMVTGNGQAGELLGALQRETTMLLCEKLDQFRFWPLFREYLLWQQAQEYSVEERKSLYGRAARYYELREDLVRALDCCRESGEYRKATELLLKNSERHPGLAHFDEMEPYYRALPEEEIRDSPSLMCAMSMLSAVCLDYEESERWYRELKDYTGRLKRSDAQYKDARGRLFYLDVGLPQRGTMGLADMIKNAAVLLTDRELVLPAFSVTSCLPSIMNGGKDFSEWSRIDDLLYATLRRPVELLLGRDGVGLPDCAIAESKFEKGEDISGRALDLMGELSEIQRRGTPDIEFAAVGLLVRLRTAQGQADRAAEYLLALRERFEQQDCARFLPNIDAMLCRLALYRRDERAVDAWYEEKAPRDMLRLRGMMRYQYLTRAMVEITMNDCRNALFVLAPLRTYFEGCHRIIDLIHLDVLTAVCFYRLEEGDWKAHMRAAVERSREYQFIRTIGGYGAAVLPLLTELDKVEDRKFLGRLVAAARMQAAYYPDFMRCRARLEEPLTTAERRTLRLVCANKSNAEIGEILGIKVSTVKTHVSSLLRKLGAGNRAQLQEAARRMGLR